MILSIFGGMYIDVASPESGRLIGPYGSWHPRGYIRHPQSFHKNPMLIAPSPFSIQISESIMQVRGVFFFGVAGLGGVECPMIRASHLEEIQVHHSQSLNLETLFFCVNVIYFGIILLWL